MKKRTIVSLQGPMAVGKTTVACRLERRLKDVHFNYEDPYPLVAERNRLRLDINMEDGFIQNQKLFIQAACDRYDRLPAGSVVMDRGPEDTECFTLSYPLRIGVNWDVLSALAPELAELKERRSDHVLYLTASPEILLLRKHSDVTRGRRAFDLEAFSIYEDWFRQNTDAVFVDVGLLAPDEVEELMYEMITTRLTS